MDCNKGEIMIIIIMSRQNKQSVRKTSIESNKIKNITPKISDKLLS
jgi:hypothetical protein